MATHIVVISFFLLVVAGSFTDLLRDSASSLQEAEKTAFTWTNCGSNEDTTKIVSLEVSPDPIVLGGNLTLSGSAILGETVRAGQGYSISLTVYKEYWDTWVYVPCINGIGSCTFDDVCSLLYKSPRTACPLSEWGIPCACPLAAGSYVLPSPGFRMLLQDPEIDWLTDGKMKVKVGLRNPKGTQIACYEFVVSLTTL